jgi:peptidyl-prolyl cis-trans isomerase SurA
MVGQQQRVLGFFGRAVGAILATALAGPCVGWAAPEDIIEEIIAQVNDRIIVLSEYQRSLESLRQELEQSGVSGLELESRYREESQNVLRELIDHELLVQKALELGLNADTDVIKRLDEIRQSMNLPSMEALEEAVASQGLNYEDFKQNLRDSFLTQWVIQREVGSRVQVTPDEIKAYYEAHQGELVQQEGVELQQILISTEGKSAEELPVLRQKAEEVLAKAKAGEDFAELARQNSDDASASRGGNVGFIESASLSPEIAAALAPLEKDGITEIIETRYGLMILKVLARTQAGVPPLPAVETRIHERLYLERIQPAMRGYLTTLRQESFISVKPGYVDTGAVAAAVSASAP